MDLDNKVIDFVDVTQDDDGFLRIIGVIDVSIRDTYVVVGSTLSENVGYRETLIPFVNLKRIELFYKDKEV
jgi:hypothetical protein